MGRTHHCQASTQAFPGSSAGKESACNAGDPGLIPGVGKIPWRRNRLPTPVFLGFSGGSMVKSPPAKKETWVQFLSWEDPPEKEMATDSSILAWRISWTEEPCGLQSMGSKRVGND